VRRRAKSKRPEITSRCIPRLTGTKSVCVCTPLWLSSTHNGSKLTRLDVGTFMNHLQQSSSMNWMHLSERKSNEWIGWTIRVHLNLAYNSFRGYPQIMLLNQKLQRSLNFPFFSTVSWG